MHLDCISSVSVRETEEERYSYLSVICGPLMQTFDREGS